MRLGCRAVVFSSIQDRALLLALLAGILCSQLVRKKNKQASLRLDAEAQAIVERFKLLFGDTVSENETVQRLIKAADDQKFVTVVTSRVASPEELSFLAGQIDRAKILWREIKSRLNAPRPLDQSDVAAVKQWRDDRLKIARFYQESDSLWQKARAMSDMLTETSPAEWEKMQNVANQMRRWADHYQTAAATETNSEEKQRKLEFVAGCQAVLEFFVRLGIRPILKK